MEQKLFIKNNIIEELAFLISSVENAKKFAENLFDADSVPDSVLYTIINRQRYLKDILETINSPESKLITISGFQGTGKTELVKTVFFAAEENVLSFYYECSQITHLDDIIITLYKYLYKNLSKDVEFSRVNKEIKNKSVDKKLINYLKNLKRPLLIAIDGIENFVNDERVISDSELLRFLNYLLFNTSIKLIIAGRIVPNKGFNIEEDKCSQFKLAGLEEKAAIQLLQDNNVQASENVLYQAFEITRGYPESILLFANAVNLLKSSAFDIIKDYSIRNENFEDYIFKKIYGATPVSLKKILWFFALIRHSISLSAINKLNLSKNIADILKILNSSNLIQFDNELYYCKENFKNIIYQSIPANELIKMHTILAKLYAEQTENNLDNRIFRLSRKTLHSEHYHHHLMVRKIQENPNSVEQIKYISDMPLVSSYIASKYNISSSLDETVIKDVKLGQDDISKFESKEVIEIDTQAKKNINLDDLNLGNDIKFELSDEEKNLLQSDDDVKEENNSQYPNSANLENEEKKAEKTIEQQRDSYIKNAIIAKKKGHTDLCLNYYHKSLDICKSMQDTINVARISKAIANILETLHRYDESLAYFNESLSVYHKLNDQSNVHLILLKLADTCKNNYKHDDAIKYYQKIILSGQSDVNNNVLISVFSGLGDIYDYREELDNALKYYFSAFDIAKSINNTKNTAMLSFKIGLIYDDLDNADKAMEYYQNCIQTSDDTQSDVYLAASYSNMASIFEDMNDTNNAIVNYAKSLEIDKLNNNYEGQYKNLSRLGRIYSELDVKDKAIRYFLEEVKAAKLTKDPYLIAHSYIDIGDYYLADKQYENAVRSFILARKSVGKTISTDSKEKIDRRFKKIISEIGEIKFNILIENIRRKYG